MGLRIGFFSGGQVNNIGSGRQSVLPLARAVAAMGHSAFLLDVSRLKRATRSELGATVHYEPLGPQLLRLPGLLAKVARSRIPGTKADVAEAAASYYMALGAVQLAAARHLRLDVLYSQMNMNVMGVLAMGVPRDLTFAINLVGFGIDESRGHAIDTFPYQERIFERGGWDLQFVATDSEHARYRQVYTLLGLSTDYLVQLPYAVDTEQFRPMPATIREQLRADMGISPEELALIYPVNVYPRKNIELALDVLAAMNRKRPARLVVTGAIWDAGYHQTLLSRAQAAGTMDRVTFPGGVSERRLVEAFNAADVTIFPSHQETFGHGLAESLICGTPAVGPDWIPACRDVLDGMAGGRVAAKSVGAFVKAVQEAASAGQRSGIAADAAARFGSTRIARHFIEAVSRRHAAKREWRQRLASIDWKDLYNEDDSLLPGGSSQAEPCGQASEGLRTSETK